MVVNLLFLVVQQKPPLSQTFCISLSPLTTLSDSKTQSNLNIKLESHFKKDLDCEQSLIFLLRHGRMRVRELRAHASGEWRVASGKAVRNEGGARAKKK